MTAAEQPTRRLQRRGGALQRRARPQVQRASVAVPLPVQPTAAECVALVKALVKHLLFQRAQIPYLYDELLRSVRQQQHAAAVEAEAARGSGRRRRMRMPKANKRLVKLQFLDKAEELLGAVDAALRTLTTPARCFVLLGSSAAKPREAYEVLLPAPSPAGAAAAPAAGVGAAAAAAAAQAAPQPAAAQEEPQARGVASSVRARLSRSDRLCQLAVRHLVVAGAELPEGTAHKVPCKLFVLLEAGSFGAGSSGGGSGGGSSNPMGHQGGWQHAQQQEGEAVQAAPCGFAVKRNFKLSMRRGLHLKLLLGQQSDQQQHEQQQQQGHAAGRGGPGEGSSESRGIAAATAPTLHLSQLPDAAAGSQQPQGELEAGPCMAAGGAVGAVVAAGSGQGSVWYLCKAVPKGLNSGSNDGGCAQSFDGL